VGCVSCGRANIRSNARNKEPHTGVSRRAGKYVFLDIEHSITTAVLTPATTYKFYLIVVYTFSSYVRIYGLGNKPTKAVVQALKDYESENSSPNKYCYVNIEKI